MRTLPSPPSSDNATASSCITTASAPAGICAPVKMRAAVPAASGVPTVPAGMRWATRSTVPAAPQSAMRTA
jgi:hypothetical protein